MPVRVGLLIGVAFAAACSGSVGPGEPQGGFARNGAVSLRHIGDFPEGDGPFPVLVYDPGSGAVSTFHATSREHRRQLVSLGFAVVRYDKRGVGESDGELLSLGTANIHEVIPTLVPDGRTGPRGPPGADGD